MIEQLKTWIRFLGFPKQGECLVRKVNIDNIYIDFIEAQSWLYPHDKPEDELSIKNYMKNLPSWNCFLSSFQEGDELWYYRFPSKMWQKLRGSHGYAILRNGKYYLYFEIAKN